MTMRDWVSGLGRGGACGGVWRRWGPLSVGLFALVAAVLLSWSGAARAAGIDVAPMVSAANSDPDTSTFMAVRLSDGRSWISNAARANARHSPASTSKIVHTLIALEAGAATPKTVFPWTGQDTWNEAWRRDQTLDSAFKASAVWVFQEIVSQIGGPQMAAWLARLDYGNANTGTAEQLTTYWLDGTLQISAREQVEFLSKLARQELPLSDATYHAGKRVMLAESGPGFSLYAKTGWRHSKDIMDIGWYVGWVECADDAYVFAFNMDMPDASLRNQRQATARAVLHAIGAFDCR